MQTTFLAIVFLTGLVLGLTATTACGRDSQISLTELLVSRFGDLSLAERRLGAATALGQTADCTLLSGDDKKIRGDLLAWLCTNPQATAQLTYRGISITGAEIVRALDLEWAKVAFPITASGCVFKDQINITNSNIAFLSLFYCTVAGFEASQAHFTGSLFLIGATITHGVELTSAKIDEHLACNGSQFTGNEKVLALEANDAEVKESVFLRNGFTAEGGVDLVGARIDGDLDCGGGQFTGNEKVLALEANDAKVKGSVFLRNGFKAEGGVDIHTAKIDVNLECDGGQFTGNEKVVALKANDAEVKGSVFLRNGFKAEGGVDIHTAKIDANLECDEGKFVGKQGSAALLASGVKIGGYAFLRNRFSAEGNVTFHNGDIRSLQWFKVQSRDKATVDLRLCKIGTLLNRQDSWPAEGHLLVDGCVYEQIDDTAPPNAQVQLNWLSLQPRDRFRSQPFEQLAGVLRKMGFEEDARQVMIAKNIDHASYVQGRPEWLWYGLFGHLIGYGYEPWRAFFISVVVIVIGWAAFRRGYCRGLVTPTAGIEYTIENDEAHPLSKDYPKFNAFVYSLETFVPLVKLGVADHWEPNGNRDAFFVERSWLMTGGCLRGYLWFHIIAGWVLTTLWVGGITGLVKT